jgi:hypothetical protein
MMEVEKISFFEGSKVQSDKDSKAKNFATLRLCEIKNKY